MNMIVDQPAVPHQPPGPASGRPDDELRDMRDRKPNLRTRISLRSSGLLAGIRFHPMSPLARLRVAIQRGMDSGPTDVIMDKIWAMIRARNSDVGLQAVR